MHLLDVNVLIARADSFHPHHSLAVEWFPSPSASAWATCPMVENGFLWILGRPAYPGGPGGMEGAVAILRRMTRAVGHNFLPDDVSLLSGVRDLEHASSAELTDLYLLALAVRHGAKFLTLDRSIDPARVQGGAESLQLLNL